MRRKVLILQNEVRTTAAFTPKLFTTLKEGYTLKAPKSDVAVLLVTFGLTVLVDLTEAIEIGMVLSAFLFMRRMALATNIKLITSEIADDF
jgi:MFS superfamily sulfate permease-like transporter